MDETQPWFLMKREDGTIFGPVPLNQLRQWAHDAQISSFDMVSTDQIQWSKAPMVPELGMDYIVEVGPDQYYGPTTLGALAEFLGAKEITPESTIINCKTSAECQVKDFPDLELPEQEPQPVRTSTRLSLHRRIRQLEEALEQERRIRTELESRCEQLETILEQAGIELAE